MLINFGTLKLKTYSIDLICVQKGEDTLSSSFDIKTEINYLNKNGIDEVKNRVENILLTFSDKDIDLYPNNLSTLNYKVEFDGKREYTIKDKSNRNNIRYLYNKKKMIEKIYLLEINRLKSTTLDELVADIKKLNNNFENLKER